MWLSLPNNSFTENSSGQTRTNLRTSSSSNRLKSRPYYCCYFLVPRSQVTLVLPERERLRNTVVFIWSHILRNVQQVLLWNLISFFGELRGTFELVTSDRAIKRWGEPLTDMIVERGDRRWQSRALFLPGVGDLAGSTSLGRWSADRMIMTSWSPLINIPQNLRVVIILQLHLGHFRVKGKTFALPALKSWRPLWKPKITCTVMYWNRTSFSGFEVSH